MKSDQRIILTKRLLKEGLFRLLKNKELDKIAVTELCLEAGVNRATFYRHYEYPKDILDDVRKEISEDIKFISTKRDFKDDISKWLLDSCTYFYEHKDTMVLLFKCRSDDNFVKLINEICQERIPGIKKKGFFKDYDSASIKLCLSYFAGGMFYIIREWLSESLDKTPKDIAELIEQHFINLNTK